MASCNVRDRLLEVAGPVFSEKGFEKTTVREICQKADVNLASVNYYSGNGARETPISFARQTTSR